MSEGFADGIAMIVDEMTWAVLDHESGRGFIGDYHPFMNYSNVGINPNLHHPFVSEFIFAKIMLDMWDGINNYAAFLNTNSSFQFYDNGDDLFEMSLKDILLPIINTSIPDMPAYYNALLNGDCAHDQQLKDLWQLNFQETTLPLDDIMVMNTDEITRKKTITHTRFDLDDEGEITGSSTYQYNYPWLDVSTLLGGGDNFNITRFDLSIIDVSTGFPIGGGQLHNFSPVVLSDNISIQNGAILSIHGGNQPMFSNQPAPPQQAWTFTQFHDPLEVQLCGNRTCTIENNGLVEVGVPNQHIADFIIKEGSTLNIKNATLRIHNNSRVIIEQGAELLYEQGAQIELLGSNAVLEIRGNLTLADNAIFSFTGAGFVRFDLPSTGGDNLSVGSNCELQFIGSSPSDKVVEVASGTYLSSYALAKTTLQNGTCELGANAFWDTGNGAVHFENAHFTASNPAQKFETILTNGQNPHIQHCVFSYAKTGLTARNFMSIGAGLHLEDVEIHHCITGLKSYDKGADLYSVNFHHNETGWKQEYASFNSSWNYSTATHNNNVGVLFQGSSDFYAENPNIHTNGFGLVYQSNGIMKANCGNISHNENWGITIADNGRLDLANSWGNTPRVNLSDNYIGIALLNADYLYLNDGYNYLSPANITGSMAIAGYLNDPMATLNFHHNQWNDNNPYGQVPNAGTAPIQGQDYDVNNHLIHDPTPIAYTACEQISTERIPYIPTCGECQMTTTNEWGEMRLDETTQAIADDFYNQHNFQHIITTIERLYEVFTYDYDTLTLKDKEILDIAWRMMKVAYAEGIKQGVIASQPTGELGSIPNMILNLFPIRIEQAPTSIFSIKLDKVMMYALANRPQLALTTLAQIETSTNREAEMKTYWNCFLEIRKDIQNATLLPQDLTTRLAQCPSLSIPSLPFSNNKIVKSSPLIDALTLYPNPTKEKVYVELSFAHEEEVMIQILDITGKEVFYLPPSIYPKGTSTYQLNLPRLSSGLYHIVVHTSNNILTEKLQIE